jgi:hypothetical protein
MELSKLKIEIYDLLGIILPGLLALAICSTIHSGLSGTVVLAKGISGSGLTLLLLCSFAAGQIVQEASDRLVKLFKGPRFFKSSRDAFWSTVSADRVRARIRTEADLDVETVDAAFDHCLTCIGSLFAKRDTFLAISDMARSLWLLSIVSLWPLAVEVKHMQGLKWKLWLAGRALMGCSLLAYLSWTRMVRFRQLSEVPVFNIFLAQVHPPVGGKPLLQDD